MGASRCGAATAVAGRARCQPGVWMPLSEPEPHTLSVPVALGGGSDNRLRSTLDAVPFSAVKLRESEGSIKRHFLAVALTLRVNTTQPLKRCVKGLPVGTVGNRLPNLPAWDYNERQAKKRAASVNLGGYHSLRSCGGVTHTRSHLPQG